ncbi:DUF192 domain-containing protein [Celeribacter sp.]|uniref:DUF192 domain-containing protein n=1 Tax=Celeribacter sp. TaxID=1890673 RepID=UPI003A9455B5
MALAQEVVACAPDEVLIRGDFGEMRFDISVADDALERGEGLMHVPVMPRTEGMLFVYERPQQVAFWMKNTLIPLDMIFVDGRGVVLQIHENAVPGDLTPIPSHSDEVVAVLEINGGMSSMLGLEIGDRLAHPAFGAEAALPCAAE